MFPSFMKRITIVSPRVATIGEVAGNPRPLIVKPPRASLLIQTMSWLAPYSSVVALAGIQRLHDERPEQTSADLVRRVVVAVVHVGARASAR